jgi:hypothetical protein
MAPQGGHPHSDRPNWKPGDDDADELLDQKVRDRAREICEAIRQGKSERHIAKLFGVPRTTIWRMKLMGQIPKTLFDRLLDGIRSGDFKLSTKSMAAIGRCLKDGNLTRGEVQCCPQCGYVLRARPDINNQAAI